MGASDSNKPPVRASADLLEEAAARNQSVEIQQEESSGEVRTAKTRLLWVDDAHLYLDLPTVNGSAVKLSPQQVIDVYTWVKGQIYTFRSSVVRCDCSIKLNGDVSVRGVQITKPDQLLASQRRNNFRVSMASMGPVDITIHEAATTNPSTAPCDARRATGRLVNVSTGGCGLVLPVGAMEGFGVGKPVYVSFTLPSCADALLFQAKISQISSVLEGKATRVGLQLIAWPSAASFGRMIRPLERFVADAQRAMARRIRPRR